MDVTKIFAILCGFLLIVCLTLAITCLTVMRNAVDETAVWQERAEALVNELDGCMQVMKEAEAEDLPVIAPENSEDNAPRNRYCLRLEGERIGIYDADGFLIEELKTEATLLPKAERQKLLDGVWAEDWKALQKLVQDYE